ncbi:MAG: hypothetical protein WCP39_05640 [Chlamydiota bacterium]
MLLISTALLAEATPIIQFFHLKPKHTKGFRVWENNEIRLVISGSGKIFSSAATSFLIALTENCQGYVNIGIASHKTLPIGTPILADTITDDSTKKSCYPSLVFESPCPTGSVLTVDTFQKELSSSCQDMEAYAFFLTATKFLPIQLVHVLKVVSDNAASPHHLVTEKKISEWIAAICPTLQTLLYKISEVSKNLPEINEMENSEDSDECPCTVSKKQKLSDILERIDAFKTPKEKIVH